MVVDSSTKMIIDKHKSFILTWLMFNVLAFVIKACLLFTLTHFIHNLDIYHFPSINM